MRYMFIVSGSESFAESGPPPAATVLSRIRLPGSGTAATLSLEVICANIAAQVIAINERVNKVRFTFGLARN